MKSELIQTRVFWDMKTTIERCNNAVKFARKIFQENLAPNSLAWQIIAREKARGNKHKSRLKQLIILEYKGQGCEHCDETRHKRLTFHHNDPYDKVECISNLKSRRTSLKTFIEEIEKCMVVCKKCHDKIHMEMI